MAEKTFDIDVEFDPSDEVDETEAEELIDALASTSVSATVTERHPTSGALPVLVIVAVVGVSMTTVTGLAVIAAFLYRVFKCGVIIDLQGRKPCIKKDKAMPRGSLLVLYANGHQEYREGISDSDLSSAIRDLISLDPPSGR